MFSPRWRFVSLVLLIGLILKFGSPIVWRQELSKPVRTWAFLVPYLLGNACYFWGCFLFARTKNRSGAWGCTGLLCVLALPILYKLADHYERVQGTAQKEPSPA